MNTIAPNTNLQGNALTRLWRNGETRSKLLQFFVLILLISGVMYLLHNAQLNLSAQGRDFSYDFLGQPAGYEINQKLIEYNNSDSTHFRAMMVGLLNTLVVAIFSILLATVLGFTLGVMRLSHNWLANKIAYLYIEYVRNVPALIHIFIVYTVFQVSLPQIRDVASNDNPGFIGQLFADMGIYLTNRGLIIPTPELEPLFNMVVATFIGGIIFAWFFSRYAKKIQNKTGKHYPVALINLAAILLAPLVVFVLLGNPIHWNMPEFTRFNFTGGTAIIPEFIALWLGLSLYSAAFIGEIVRAGIKAVNWGQTEAASALGLSRRRTLSLVVIPQAMRVIVPPLTSQYLNITKNSSLATAVSYMEIMGTIGGPTLTNTGSEMEIMIIILLLYLILSLIISAIMNWYNHRIKLVER